MRAAPGAGDVAALIAALDARGAWVTNDNEVPVPNAPSDDAARETVRGISTGEFVKRMSVLLARVR